MPSGTAVTAFLTNMWKRNTYDGSTRQLTSTEPDGSVTATSYNGNAITTTDPAGIWKSSISNAFSNLIAVNEPDPATGSPTTGPTTTYTHNGYIQRRESAYERLSDVRRRRAEPRLEL